MGKPASYIALALLCGMIAIALSGCGGGNGFTPDTHPFSGTFTDDSGTTRGTFSFTASGGFIAGTATLLHIGRDYNLSVSGTYTGQAIEGQIVNSLEGSGTFTGRFTNTGTASGTFVFTDTLELDTTAGTWQAATPE
jgi:hypothetical protein